MASRWNRPWVWIATAVALAAVAFGYARVRGASRAAEISYETVKVDRGRIVPKVTATGTLSALVTVQVGSQVSGRLKAIYVDFNSEVQQGQVLARIDPQLFDAAREQARANHLAARGNLAKSKAQAVDAHLKYRRAQAVSQSGLLAQGDLDTAKAEADAADAQIEASQGAVEQTRAALHQAEVNLGYTTIVSPIHGVVISRNVDVGQTVAASLQTPTLFLIAEDLRRMQVDTSVGEADIGRLASGMRASFTVDAYPGEKFAGVVRQIRNAPQTVQNVVTYDAVIDVDNPELKLKPGMTANVTFVYSEKTDALRVPNAALRFRPPPELESQARTAGTASPPPAGAPPREAGTAPTARPDGASGARPEGAPGTRSGGTGSGRSGGGTETGDTPHNKRTVWVLRDGKPQAVPVTTGVTDGSMTEIVDGDLHEGDAVITDSSGGTSRPSGSAPAAGPPGGLRRMF